MRYFLVTYTANKGSVLGDCTFGVSKIGNPLKFNTFIIEYIKETSDVESVSLTSVTEITTDLMEYKNAEQ